MSGGGGSRVPIPNNVRKTIQDIREITGKQHSDDEIYAVLKECSMDPNETAQKLLYLDTFHEVRRRRDRKKEGLSSKASEDFRSKQAGQGRGGRGASGGYSAKFPDGAGARNSAIRGENGFSHISERGQAPSTRPVLPKTKNSAASQSLRVSAVAPNGHANQFNGNSGAADGQALVDSVMSVSKSSSAIDGISKQEDVEHQAAVVAVSSPTQTFGSINRVDKGKSLPSPDQFSAASAPGVDPAVGGANAINGEVGSQWIAAGVNHVKGNKVVLSDVGESLASKGEQYGSLNSTSKMMTPNKSNEVEKNQFSETSQPFSSLYNGSLMSSSICSSQLPPVNVSEVSTSEVCAQSSSAGLKQHVTFPNHFQVPEALKNGLTFGSFDSNLGQKERSSSGTGGDNNTSPALESSLGSDETATSSNQSASSPGHGDHPDYPHTSSFWNEMTPPLEGNAIASTDSKGDQPKQEVLTPEGPPISTVQNAQNCGLNFMSTILGTQQFQLEAAEPQAQETSALPNFVGTNSQTTSSPSPTPPLQSSIHLSPQPVSIFRPPYPSNFFPYGHYYPPIYVSPIHQFLSHNGFPQQPSAGNLYLPAAAGVKFPLPQFKAGTTTGNMAHIGIPSGSFISPPVGYAPSPTMNTGSSPGNEDLAVSQLKENHIYTTGQLSEGSAVWIPSPGQDISSLQVNSLYNLAPSGHLAFPPTQAGRGAFAGIYQPGQAVASHTTLLQQSQAVAGAVETVGPPSGAYQQPQHAQINWNSNF